MIRKRCSECGITCWHNKMPAKSGSAYRCTYCGFPLGTGPKKDRMVALHTRQVRKASKS